jgi:DNA-binding transcriptional regulator LsrR (DeoR family)
MRSDRIDKAKRALELEASGLNRAIIAERLGVTTSHLKGLLERAKRAAAKE